MARISHPLEFELPLVELECELEALQDDIASGDQSRLDDYARLEKRVEKLRKEIYGKLTPFQQVQLSRHFDRPFTLDFIKYIISDFIELHGDRCFREDPAIVAGTGKLGQMPVVVVGHQRGRTTAERLGRNFGMPQPDGYRKALRMFRLAEKFGLPLITFIDTSGAYPGIEAEERGQAEAIASNLIELTEITIPVISVVIGEGGSGGALAIGIADRILMLENACYSVISPEGCASILWHKEGEDPYLNAPIAAEALKLTAQDLHKFGVVDEIVQEPVGGAHRNHKEAAENLRAVLVNCFEVLQKLSVEDLLEQRYRKYRNLGVFTGDS